MAAHGCTIQRPTLLERRHGQSVAIVRALNRRRHRQRAGRLHRRRSAKPANSERATSSAAPTSTGRCRFSGVGRRPHRCAGTPSSGSSADFPAASARPGGTCSGAWGRHRAGCPVGAARVAGDPATPATRRPGDPATRRPGDPPGGLTPTITVCIAWAPDPGPRQVRGSCQMPCPLIHLVPASR